MHADANPQLGQIRLEVDRTIAEAQDKLKRKPDRASSPSIMNGHTSTASFTAAGSSGEHICPANSTQQPLAGDEP